MGLQTRGRRAVGRDGPDTSGAPTRSDLRDLHQAGRQRDEPLERAYNAGRRGDDPAEYQTDDELWGYYQDGAKASKAEQRQARTADLRSSAGAKAGSVASDGAGFLLGLIGYALLYNYLRWGSSGVRAWLSAKFLNNTSDPGHAKPATPSTPATPASPDATSIARRVGS
jgi:hypothetical protein